MPKIGTERCMNLMKKGALVLSFFIFMNFVCATNLAAMEPDEEALKDPVFVSEYGCLTEHFLLKKEFEKEEWDKAMIIIEDLEKKGYKDKFVSVAKAKIFFKIGEYEKALDNLQQALTEIYKCRLTIPNMNFLQHHDLARQAIIWHYIYQVNEVMGKTDEASSAHAKAEDLLRKSISLSYGGDIAEKDTMEIIKKIFFVFSLFQTPLRP